MAFSENTNRKIKLAIVDDHPVLRKGLISLFSDPKTFEIVIIASNGREFINFLPGQMPDIVILDIEMPEMDGVQVAAYLSKNYPEIKILVLSMYDDDSYVNYFIEEKGARGFLLKIGDEEIILEAVLTIMETGYYFDERVNRILIEGFVEDKKINPKFKKVSLSSREIQIIKLICKELTNREISQKLFISLRTIERHRNNMIKKIGARNSTGLVMFAVQNNLHNRFMRSSFDPKKRV